MNMPLTPAEIDAFAVDVGDYIDLAAPEAVSQPAQRHAGPFSKSREGYARRTERRLVRARKGEWLNS